MDFLGTPWLLKFIGFWAQIGHWAGFGCELMRHFAVRIEPVHFGMLSLDYTRLVMSRD